MPPTNRDLLIDAAEALWAVDSYDAVSLRRIASGAGVDFGLCRYYFGSKDGLFSEVVLRRADSYFDSINASMDQALDEAGGCPPTAHAWIRAMLEPPFSRLVGRDKGWRNYVRLTGNFSLLSEDGSNYVKILNQYQDPIIERFVAELNRISPNTEERNWWFFYFLQSTLIPIYRSPSRFSHIFRGKITTHNYTVILDRLVELLGSVFVAGYPVSENVMPLANERGRRKALAGRR